MILDQILDESEVSRLKKTRWAIVNFWKPLAPVLKDPLAVCDFNSVADEDLVNVSSR